MGAWSTKPFGNDTALDWVWQLEKATDNQCLLNTINSALDLDDLDASICDEAIAAVAVVVGASVDPIKGVPKEAKSWISSIGYVPDETIINKSIEALKKITTKSELRDLWEESDSLKSWLKIIDALNIGLNNALINGLPNRKTKTQSMPRVLHKLMALEGANKDFKVIAKVNEKILKLKDVNNSSAETDFINPLCLAAKFGFIDTVKLLIEQGADIDRSDSFSIAVLAGHLDIAQLLLSHGAQIYSSYYRGEFKRLIKIENEPAPAGVEISTYCSSIWVLASHGGSIDGIKFLMELGVILDQWEPNGYTLLYKAAESKNIEVVRWLIDQGVDLDAQSAFFQEIALLTSLNNYEISKLLLEAGANPNIPDRYGSTCLDKIIEGSDNNILKLYKKFDAKTGVELRYKQRTFCLKHASFEGLGMLERELVYARCHVIEIELYNDFKFPNIEEVDFLIILGGPMNVNDEEIFPWLKQEKQFIKACIDAKKPVLGICLGAQLIANVLGESVRPMAKKEIGWFNVEPVSHNNKDVFSFKDIFTPFHWHGESFDLPENAILLASSEACKNQAFQYGENVIALQFHLEIHPTDVEDFIERSQEDLITGTYIQTKQQMIERDSKTYKELDNILENIRRYLLKQENKDMNWYLHCLSSS